LINGSIAGVNNSRRQAIGTGPYYQLVQRKKGAVPLLVNHLPALVIGGRRVLQTCCFAKKIYAHPYYPCVCACTAASVAADGVLTPIHCARHSASLTALLAILYIHPRRA